jgi:hypothetical protein
MIEILTAAVVIAYVVMFLIYMKADTVEHSVYLLSNEDSKETRNMSDVRTILSVLNLRSTKDMETCYLGHPRLNSIDLLNREIVYNNEVTLPSGKLVTIKEALVLITDYLDLEVEETPATETTSKLIKRDSKDIG